MCGGVYVVCVCDGWVWIWICDDDDDDVCGCDCVLVGDECCEWWGEVVYYDVWCLRGMEGREDWVEVFDVRVECGVLRCVCEGGVFVCVNE